MTTHREGDQLMVMSLPSILLPLSPYSLFFPSFLTLSSSCPSQPFSSSWAWTVKMARGGPAGQATVASGSVNRALVWAKMRTKRWFSGSADHCRREKLLDTRSRHGSMICTTRRRPEPLSHCCTTTTKLSSLSSPPLSLSFSVPLYLSLYPPLYIALSPSLTCTGFLSLALALALALQEWHHLSGNYLVERDSTQRDLAFVDMELDDKRRVEGMLRAELLPSLISLKDQQFVVLIGAQRNRGFPKNQHECGFRLLQMTSIARVCDVWWPV